MSTSAAYRCLVAVKRVVDFAVKVRVNSTNTGVETGSGIKHSMNPFCEIATEEAIRLKDSGLVNEVIAVSIGNKSAIDTLRTALAMGADRGIHIETELRSDSELQPLIVSKALAAIINRDKIDITIVGKQSIDSDNNQLGQMLSGLTNSSLGTFVSKVKPNTAANNTAANNTGKSLLIDREIDGGSQSLEITIPTVLTTDLRLNTPRYATLPNIMKAKKKPIETIQLSALLTNPADLQPRLKLLKVTEPQQRKSGVKVDSVDTLFDKLKNEAKVI